MKIMLRFVPSATLLCALVTGAFAATTDSVVVEFETGTLAGNATVSNAGTGFTGTGYVTNIKGSGDHATVTVSVASAQDYEVSLVYRIATGSGSKGVNISLDGTALTATLANSNGAWAEQSVGKLPLAVGSHSLVAGDGWGYFDLDRVVLRPVVIAAVPAVHASLSDPNANAKTVALYQWYQGLYGKKTIAGQHMGGATELNYIQTNSGQQPAQRDYDFIEYSASRRANGSDPGKLTEQAVAWGDTGLLSFMWHWNAPDGLYNTATEKWWSGFYTAATSFNIATVLANPNSNDYQLLLNDLDTIAAQLQKAQVAGKSVLWRPLHEASGGWFWWGAQGAAPFKQLWALMYDRFVRIHGLHNLIWVCNLDPAAMDWYPGDSLCDIVGVDTYATGSAAQAEGGEWDALQSTFSGKRMLTMAENGTLPSIAVMREEGVHWLYFSTWSGFMDATDNPAALVDSVYNDTDVITLSRLKSFGWPPVPISSSSANVSSSSMIASSSSVKASSSSVIAFSSSVKSSSSSTKSSSSAATTTILSTATSTLQTHFVLLNSLSEASLICPNNGHLQVFKTDGSKIQEQAVTQGQAVSLQLPKGIYLLRWVN